MQKFFQILGALEVDQQDTNTGRSFSATSSVSYGFTQRNHSTNIELANLDLLPHEDQEWDTSPTKRRAEFGGTVSAGQKLLMPQDDRDMRDGIDVCLLVRCTGGPITAHY